MRAPPPPVRSRGVRARGLLLDLSPLRHDREFRLLYLGQLISGIGNQATRLALPFQIYVLTDSTLALGLLAFVQLVPMVVVGLLAGTLADAFDRRRLLVLTNIGMAFSTGLLLALALLPEPPIPLFYVVAFLTMTFSSIDQPARVSAVPRLVPPQRLPAAIALNQLSQQTSTIFGPAMAGVFLATVGPVGAYAFDFVSFLAAFAMLLAMRPIPHLGAFVRPGLTMLKEGFAFVNRKRILLGTFVVDLDAMIFGMPVALFPVLALDVFQVGPAGVGMLGAAPAVGAVIATVLSGWVKGVRRAGLGVITVVAIWGVAITLFGLSTFSFAIALGFLALAGAADVLSAVFRATILQLETPDELRGRVSAIHVMVVRSGPRLGDMGMATVASVAGAQFAVVSGGILVVAGLVVVARLFPELVAYNRSLVEPEQVA